MKLILCDEFVYINKLFLALDFFFHLLLCIHFFFLNRFCRENSIIYVLHSFTDMTNLYKDYEIIIIPNIHQSSGLVRNNV